MLNTKDSQTEQSKETKVSYHEIEKIKNEVIIGEIWVEEALETIGEWWDEVQETSKETWGKPIKNAKVGEGRLDTTSDWECNTRHASIH